MTKQVEQTQIDETAAQDSIKMSTVSTSEIIKKMQGASGGDWTKLKEVLDQVGKENDNLPAGANAAANRKSVDMKTVKEDLATIFGGKEDLSEEFLDQVATLFEAAVHLRTAVIEEEIIEEAAKFLEEAIAEKEAELVEGLSTYLDEVINEWTEENKLAIESSMKMVQLESFMGGLKDLFLEHDVDVPEESLDLVESMSAEIEDLKSQLNESLNKNIELSEVIDSAHQEMAFDEISEGLAATQIEKLKTLSESIDFKDLGEFKEKVKLIKEAHFGEKKTAQTVITEEAVTPAEIEDTKTPTQVSRYADAISKSVRSGKPI